MFSNFLLQSPRPCRGIGPPWAGVWVLESQTETRVQAERLDILMDNGQTMYDNDNRNLTPTFAATRLGSQTTTSEAISPECLGLGQ